MSIKSPILVKGGDISGWMTSPVTETRLILVNVPTMDGGTITVLTQKMPALSAIKVTRTGGCLTAREVEGGLIFAFYSATAITKATRQNDIQI